MRKPQPYVMALPIAALLGVAAAAQQRLPVPLPRPERGQLTVVADRGGKPARPYYDPIKPAEVPENEAYSATAQARAYVPVTEADMLPVHSQQLSPGPVPTQAIDMPAFTTPFFLIGAGKLSRRWLAQRGERLRELHAVGLVVDVDTIAQLKRLRRIGNGLVLKPVPGDDIARRLDIAHYPVLITSKAIQQ